MEDNGLIFCSRYISNEATCDSANNAGFHIAVSDGSNSQSSGTQV